MMMRGRIDALVGRRADERQPGRADGSDDAVRRCRASPVHERHNCNRIWLALHRQPPAKASLQKMATTITRTTAVVPMAALTGLLVLCWWPQGTLLVVCGEGDADDKVENVLDAGSYFGEACAATVPRASNTRA